MWHVCRHRTPELLRHGRPPWSSGHQLPPRGEGRIQRRSVQLPNHLSHHRGVYCCFLPLRLPWCSARVRLIRAGVLTVNLLPQMKTLRGSILEESVPSAARHTTPRGLSPKRLLEFIMPELNLHCLRLASNSPKVRDTLLKLDEQGVSKVTSVHTRDSCMCQTESSSGQVLIAAKRKSD